MTAPTQKLQAFLAHAGIASRRKAETLIAEGQVKVNGRVAHIGQRVTNTDAITYKGQPVQVATTHHYYLLNKPLGLVSTTADEMGRTTVLSLLPAQLRQSRLYPVGRLDQDSQGLMLLTDDGEVAYHLTHPRFEIEKTYQVTLDRAPTAKALEHLERGVYLTDGIAVPKVVTELSDTVFEITLSEGRNRQVRRMCSRVGYEVQKLTRIGFGPFTLRDLGGQTYRALTDAEVAMLKAHLKPT